MNGFPKMNWRRRGGAVACVLCLCGVAAAQAPVSTSFTYQAAVRESGQPIPNSATLEMQFSLHSLVSGAGNQIGSTISVTGIRPVDGIVSVILNESGEFGADAFNGEARFLQVSMRRAGATQYSTLTPRQALTAAPYAHFALDAPISGGDTYWAANGTHIGNTNAGAVGIGTNAPAQDLHVYENAGTGRIRVESADNQAGISFMSDSTGEFVVYSPNDTDDLRFYVSGADRVSITSAGNVGIGTTAPSAKLHVSGTSTAYGNHVALFENTGSTGADGIAIKINAAATNKDNNFVTFLNASGQVKGRIEGFDLQNGDWLEPPPLPDLNLTINPGVAIRPVSQWFSAGALPTLQMTNAGRLPRITSFSPGTLPSLSVGSVDILGIRVPAWPITFNAGSLPSISIDGGAFPTFTLSGGALPSISASPVILSTPSINFTPPTLAEVQDLVCWAAEHDLWDIVELNPLDLNFQLFDLRVAAVKACKDDGITYGSKGADYAEYLEKMDPSDELRWGEVVGVYAGKISRKTDGAEQVMVISRAPAVVGNQPADEDAGRFETVAFMGQVPVVVRGGARSGDYILASGDSDGTAIAMSAEKLTTAHLDRIVGRAWSDTKSDDIDFVNVLVGVKHEAAAHLLAKQQRMMDEQSQRIASLEQEFAEMKAMMKKVAK